MTEVMMQRIDLSSPRDDSHTLIMDVTGQLADFLHLCSLIFCGLNFLLPAGLHLFVLVLFAQQIKAAHGLCKSQMYSQCLRNLGLLVVIEYLGYYFQMN